MKTSLLVFFLISIAQISVIKGKCRFKYTNGTIDRFGKTCECGPKGKSYDYPQYCCVPSNSTCDESKSNTKWCAAGQLLTKYQACNGSCMDLNQRICTQIKTAPYTAEQCYTKGYTAEDEYSVILI